MAKVYVHEGIQKPWIKLRFPADHRSGHKMYYLGTDKVCANSEYQKGVTTIEDLTKEEIEYLIMTHARARDVIEISEQYLEELGSRTKYF